VLSPLRFKFHTNHVTDLSVKTQVFLETYVGKRRSFEWTKASRGNLSLAEVAITLKRNQQSYDFFCFFMRDLHFNPTEPGSWAVKSPNKISQLQFNADVAREYRILPATCQSCPICLQTL
jgi:hypothetical protein